MPKVLIPNTMKPNFCVSINGTKYSYPAGTMQDVPDEVAQVIENHVELYYPEHAASGAGEWDAVISTTDLSAARAYKLTSGSYEDLKKKMMAGTHPKVLVVLTENVGPTVLHETYVAFRTQVDETEDAYIGVYIQTDLGSKWIGLSNDHSFEID